MRWMLSVVLLMPLVPAHSGEIDPRLVGVWLDEPGANRIEIDARGKLTLWSNVYNRQRGLGVELKFENERELDMVDPGSLSLPLLGPLVANPRNGTASLWHSKNRTGTFLRLDENGRLQVTKRAIDDVPLSTRPVGFTYTVEEKSERTVLTLSTQAQPRAVIRYEKLRFGATVNDIENGPRALHDRQVFHAALVHALDEGMSGRFAEMLAGSDGDFLRDEAMLEDQSSAALLIRQRIYSQLLRRNEVDALKALLANTALRPQPEHISSRASDEMKAYLWEILEIDPQALSRHEIGLLARLMNQRYFLGPSLQFKRLYGRHGCERAHEIQFQNRAMRVETAEEQADQEAENAARHTDAGFYFRVNEEAFKLCLQNFDKGIPIPERVLSATTIPGLSVDEHGLTNPLYFFADPTIVQSVGSRREEVFNPYTYSVMKVLLDFGADPSHKPSPDHPALAEFMYEHAPHEQFKRALQLQSERPRRAAKNIDVQRTLHHIQAYNEVMARIGGEAYASVQTNASTSTGKDRTGKNSKEAIPVAATLPFADTAGVLSLANSGFEAPRVSQYRFGVDAWQGVRHGVVVPPANMFPHGIAPEGRQLGFLSRPGSWMSQTLPLQPAPAWRYTMQVFAGVRLEPGFDAGHLTMEFRVGEKVVAAQQFATPVKGEFEAMTLTYETPESPPQGALTVVLRNVDTRQINVDLVRVYGHAPGGGNELPAFRWENSLPESEQVTHQERVSANPGSSQPQPAAVPPASEIVGFWNYDGHDGLAIPGGLTLIEKPGSGLGKSWSKHLQLKTHDQLRPRQRTLWPVELKRAARKVCVNYPNYPSYAAHLDLPGEVDDGIYAIGPCN